MKLLVQNGKNINIEQSIMSNANIQTAANAHVRNGLGLFPFPNGNNNILNKYNANNDITCWGLSPRYRQLASQITQGSDHFILCENQKLFVPSVQNPHPRVITGKIVHVEANIQFGNYIWNEPNEWEYIFFLKDVHVLKYTKEFICVDNIRMSGSKWYRFGPNLY